MTIEVFVNFATHAEQFLWPTLIIAATYLNQRRVFSIRTQSIIEFRYSSSDTSPSHSRFPSRARRSKCAGGGADQIVSVDVRLLAECDDRDRRSSVRRGKPLCLIGDSGTGKSHLLIGLGTAAAEKGFRVKYTLAPRLVNELVEAADEKNLARTIARCGRVDLLMIDELGYMELDRRGAELLFQVLTEREENNSIAIASKRVLLRLDEDLHRPQTVCCDCGPPHVQRHHHRNGTDSYRLAHTRQQRSNSL